MVESSLYNGRLSFVGTVRDTRFLIVELRCPAAADNQIARLAHELRHAVEIAEAPEVRDEPSMLEHYRKIGWPSVADCHERRAFETVAAKEAGDAVRREMRK